MRNGSREERLREGEHHRRGVLLFEPAAVLKAATDGRIIQFIKGFHESQKNCLRHLVTTRSGSPEYHGNNPVYPNPYKNVLRLRFGLKLVANINLKKIFNHLILACLVSRIVH